MIDTCYRILDAYIEKALEDGLILYKDNNSIRFAQDSAIYCLSLNNGKKWVGFRYEERHIEVIKYNNKSILNTLSAVEPSFVKLMYLSIIHEFKKGSNND